MSTMAVPARPRSHPSARAPTEAWLILASAVAQAAAAVLTARRDAARAVRTSRGRDIKLAGDEALHRLIRTQLTRQSPFPVVSEEGRLGPDISARRERWIVDPLDGSLNFSRGIPLSCVSIALWRGMNPRLGVILDVDRMECFSGVVGHGAWLNGIPIAVSGVGERSQAILCTGFPVRADYSSASLGSRLRAIQAYKKVRLLGSAALSLAYVACGRADAYQEERIALWDVAAGLAIVQAAGGRFRLQLVGGSQTLVNVLAANQLLETREER